MTSKWNVPAWTGDDRALDVRDGGGLREVGLLPRAAAVSARHKIAAAKTMDTILLMGCSSFNFPQQKTAKAKCFDRWNRKNRIVCKSNIALRKKYCDSRTDLLCTPNSSGSQKPYHFGGSTFCMPSATFERLGQATDWFRASISLSLTVISLFTGVPVICA